jgi:integrase/recombinase XerD
MIQRLLAISTAPGTPLATGPANPKEPEMPLSNQLFARFEQEMKLRNYARTTIKTYLCCLRAYVRWLHPTLPRDATNDQIHDFLLSLVSEGRSKAWIAQSISTLKFLYIELYNRPAAAVRLRYPRRQSRLPYVPTRAEVLQIAGALTNRKHRLAVLLLYASGLRASELIALKVGDVNFEKKTLTVHAGKGGRDRVTLFSAELAEDLRRACDQRAARDPLFPSAAGGPWTTRSLQKVVRRAARRAGVSHRITPHSLRHAFATHLLEGGTDLRFIQSLMGHASIETTTRYARVQDPGALGLSSPL